MFAVLMLLLLGFQTAPDDLNVAPLRSPSSATGRAARSSPAPVKTADVGTTKEVPPEASGAGPAPGSPDDAPAAANAAFDRYDALLTAITIFVLAVFVGFEVISKVPTTLHTPLMSGSNAISGITVVGAIILGGVAIDHFASFVGFLAIVLATINVVGGFLVTHRMLAMFKRR